MMITLKQMIEPLKKVSPEEFLMFKHWLINIATSGMTNDQKKEVEGAVENSEEVENMLYNLEKAITNEFHKVKEEDAINFLELGVDEAIVAKGTGLSIEKIRELKSKIKH